MVKEPLPEHIPYQQAAQVRQLLAERANCEAIGMPGRVAGIEKALRNLGYEVGEKAPEVRRDKAPEQRQAPAEKAVTAETGAKRPARKADAT